MVATAAELDRAIADFVARLEKGIRVEAIVLYGSYARGTAYEQSDIDVAVISPDFDAIPMYKRQEQIALLTLYRDLRITPIGYPSSQYHDPDPSSFLSEIIRTGRVVYEGGVSPE
jgi:predicted nucleotidyltransferase